MKLSIDTVGRRLPSENSPATEKEVDPEYLKFALEVCIIVRHLLSGEARYVEVLKIRFYSHQTRTTVDRWFTVDGVIGFNGVSYTVGSTGTKSEFFYPDRMDQNFIAARIAAMIDTRVAQILSEQTKKIEGLQYARGLYALDQPKRS